MNYISSPLITSGKVIKFCAFDRRPITCLLVLAVSFGMVFLARSLASVQPLSSLVGLIAARCCTITLGLSILVFFVWSGLSGSWLFAVILRPLGFWYLVLPLVNGLAELSCRVRDWRLTFSVPSQPDIPLKPSLAEESAALASFYKAQYIASHEVHGATVARNEDTEARLRSALSLIADQNDIIAALQHAQATGRMSRAVQEEIIADLQDAVATRDHTISDLKDTVTSQDQTIAELEASYSTASTSISTRSSSSSVNDKTFAELHTTADTDVPTKQDILCIQSTLTRLIEDVGSITKTLKFGQSDPTFEDQDKPPQDALEDLLHNTRQDDSRGQHEARIDVSQMMMTINDLRDEMKVLRADLNDTKQAALRNKFAQAEELNDLKMKNVELQATVKRFESASACLAEKDRAIVTYKSQLTVCQALNKGVQRQFKETLAQLKIRDAELVVVRDKLAGYKASAVSAGTRFKRWEVEHVRILTDYETRVNMQDVEIEDSRAQVTSALHHRDVQSEYVAQSLCPVPSTPRSRSAGASSVARTSPSLSPVIRSKNTASTQSSPSCSTSTVYPYPVVDDQSSFCIEDKLAKMDISCDLLHDKFSFGDAGEDSFWANKEQMVAEAEDQEEQTGKQSSFSIQVDDVSCDILHDDFSFVHKDQDSFWHKESPVKGNFLLESQSAVSSGQGSPFSGKPSFDMHFDDVSCDLLHVNLSFLNGDEDSYWLKDSLEKPGPVVALTRGTHLSGQCPPREDEEQLSFKMRPDASFDLFHDNSSFLNRDRDSFWLQESPRKGTAKSVYSNKMTTLIPTSVRRLSYSSKDDSSFNMRLDNVPCDLLHETCEKEQDSYWLGGSDTSMTAKPAPPKTVVLTDSTSTERGCEGTTHSASSFSSNLSFEFVHSSTPIRSARLLPAGHLSHSSDELSLTPPHATDIHFSPPFLFKPAPSRFLCTPESALPTSSLIQRLKDAPATPSPPPGSSKHARVRKVRANGPLEPMATNISRK
ncbi:hypothetical protein BC628DRAFT_1421423 [Trametes gibbosa]|nr:hypothetical protein BC628DRAFT_1421423 [Trametes gibbosa]